MGKDKKDKKEKADKEVAEPAEAHAEIDGVRVYCAHSELVATEALVPNPRNPNKHPLQQIELLAKIITLQGWRAPITVSRRSGFVVKGEGRLDAAKLARLSKVPVDFQDYESEAAEWADMIADNRIAELAHIDNSVLRELMTEMDTGAFDMDLTGFDQSALEELMAWTPGDEHLPGDLPPPDVEGLDNSLGRIILVFENQEQRQRWLTILGVKGQTGQVVFSLADIDGADEDGAEA
jgi:hypothetical protein